MASLEDGSRVVDLNAFWEDSAIAQAYEEKPLTDEGLAKVEKILGYKLPQFYVDICRVRNGGFPVKNELVIEPGKIVYTVRSVFGIGNELESSVAGCYGNEFLFTEWEYPRIGVYFADTGSCGHEMWCLDYRACGAEGEPCVVLVDQEDGFSIRYIARDMTEFFSMLITNEEVDQIEGATQSWCRIS